jgi:hypothetical protein
LEEFGIKQLWPAEGTIQDIFLAVLTKAVKNLCKNTLCPIEDPNPALPKHKYTA